MSAYPEHDKLDARKDERRTILMFLEWLREDKKLRFGREEDDRYGGGFREEVVQPEKLANEFLGADEKVLEQERRAMVEDFRKRPR